MPLYIGETSGSDFVSSPRSKGNLSNGLELANKASTAQRFSFVSARLEHVRKVVCGVSSRIFFTS